MYGSGWYSRGLPGVLRGCVLFPQWLFFVRCSGPVSWVYWVFRCFVLESALVNFCTLCQCLALCGVLVFCDETFSCTVCVCVLFFVDGVWLFYVVFLGLLRPVSVSLLRVCAVLCMSVASTVCVTTAVLLTEYSRPFSSYSFSQVIESRHPYVFVCRQT